MAPPPRARRTVRPLVPARQARAVRTRSRLIDAARALLVEHGLAGAPTAAVAARAEVSQGALFRHFPHKTDLLIAVTEAILAELRQAFAEELAPRRGRRRAAVAPALADPLAAACAALWRVFRRPDMRVVLEIYVCARTDAELERGLGPVLDHHQALLLDEARRLFPLAAAANPEFGDAVLAIVYAMQGAAIGLFSPDPAAEVCHLAFLERLARRELARRPTLPAPEA
ncbi:MAG: TetR/AcrR family transcriptional regulator [Kofleriaceae bacterium]